MRRIFWFFLQKLVPYESLTLPFKLFRFWLQFCEDIHVWKTTHPLSPIRGVRWLRISVIRRVTNSPHHWYAESPSPHITDTRSRRLSASPIWKVGSWIFKNKTLCIDGTKSRWFPAPVIQWVADSPYRWVGESTSRESTTPRISDTGIRYSKKKYIWCWFSELLTAKPCI